MNPATSPEWRRAAMARRDASLAVPRRAGPPRAPPWSIPRQRAAPRRSWRRSALSPRAAAAGRRHARPASLGRCEAVEYDAGNMREAGPGRLVFRPKGDQHQYRKRADALDRQIEHFERGRIGPMDVLEEHQ